MGFSEGVQALVEPANKLIETISAAIGTVYEPIKIRRLAEARAYEIGTISSAVRSNMDIPIVYNPENGVMVDAGNFQELSERAGQRFLYQEITKQQNIDSVVSKASIELESSEGVTPDPVDQDWILRFFNSVGDVSDEQMQKYWARVLAGEVKQPGSYSLRTLHTLSTLSKNEAESLQRIASFSMMSSGVNFIYQNFDLLREYELISDVITMYDCGLMSESITTSISGNYSNKEVFIGTAKIICVCHNEIPQKANLHIIRFTPMGNELLTAISFDYNQDFTLACLKKIKQELPQLNLTGHNVIRNTDGQVEYDEAIDVLA